MTAFASETGIEVTPELAARAIAEGKAIVVDVREGYEWDVSRIDGARHIPLEQLAARADDLPKDTAIVFQCRAGGRSGMAAQAFRASGYDAWSMAGGLLRWNDEGRPLVPAGAPVADH